MATWQGKKYKLDKFENFDEYMKELGVGVFLRKIGNTVCPIVELAKDGDEYTLTTSTTFKTTQMKFRTGIEFDEDTIDGRKVKSVCVFENENKLIQEQKGDKPTTIVREFSDNELIATMTIGNVKCIRIYKEN